MLTETQLQRYADVLIWGLEQSRRNPLKKNGAILIRYDLPAVRLVEILFEKLLRMGLNPIQRASLTPLMETRFFETAVPKQLTFQPPGEEELYRHLAGAIHVLAPTSLTHLAHVAPKRIGQTVLARKPLRDILDAREAQGAFSWTLCLYPTAALAAHANLSPTDYTRQIVRACYLNRRNPVALWHDVYTKAGRIKTWLNRLRVKQFHIESANIDLIVTPGEKRQWIGLSGHNIPSFELFLSPDWRGTKGVYYADQPSYRNGNFVTGVRLEFTRGSAVGISAETGEAFVRQQLAMDRGASRIGEFSLTDKRFSKIDRYMADTLFDENFGGPNGNCHIAVGAAYADTYSGPPAELTRKKKQALGFNDSALHWDLVNTEKKKVTALLAGGGKKVIYENGVFTH